MADLATAYVQIIPSAEGIQGNLTKILDGEASSAGKSAGTKMGGVIGGTMKTVAAAGMAAVGTATAAMGAFGKSAVSAGMNFDSAMSQVAATMGYSTEELNREGSEAAETFKQLREFAQEMGASTAFSASEAADALNYMALAGYDAETSMKMLPNVLNLAAAGGIDLASASDMVTDAQSALGLSLDEASAMVDQMARASSKSNTSVAQLGEAFLTIGATARNLSGGTEELSTMLGILADNGIKGAEGGTHLRNMILSLQSPTDKGAELLEQMGVAVYDADGNMRSMIDIVGDLQKGMEGMDQASKDAVIGGIFNKTDLASVNALIGTSAERFEELSGAIADSTGAAQNMANTQLDNLSGDVTLFQSALEGAKIAVSDQLTPTLREFVSLASSGVSSVTTAFTEGGLEGAMGAAGEWLSTLVTTITNYLPLVITAAMNLLGAFGQGLLDNMPVIVNVVMQIMGTIFEGIVAALPDILFAATEIIMTMLQGLTEATPSLVPAAVDAVMVLADGLIENLPVILEAGLDLLMALVDGIVDNLDLIMDSVLKIIERLISTIIQNLPKILESGIKIIVKLVEGLFKALPEIVMAIPKLVAAMIDGFLNIDWAKVGSDILDGIGSGILGGAKKLADSAKKVAEGALNGVKNFLGIASPSKVFRDEVGKMLDLGLAEGLTDNTKVVSKAANEVAVNTKRPFATMVMETASYAGTEYGRSENSDGGYVEVLYMLNNIYNIILNRKESLTVQTYLGSRELRREIYDAEDMRSLRNGGRC